MPDEHGICRCGGTGWDGCKPVKEAPPSPEAELAARLREAVQSLVPPSFDEMVEAAITARRGRPALGQSPYRAELPAPASADAVLDAVRAERDVFNTIRSRRDG